MFWPTELCIVDLKKNKQTTLAENLKEGQYAVSSDGHLMAYESEGNKKGGTEIQVMNLSGLHTYIVEAAEGEQISPLGFVNGDFIYGKMKSEDAERKLPENRSLQCMKLGNP